MLLHRSAASILHFHKLSPPHQLLAQFNIPCSSLFHSFPSSSTSFASSSSRRSPLLWLIGPRRSRAGSFATCASAAAATADRNGCETFYADDGVSWKSLGLSDKISRALMDAGIERPSLVQASSIPSIFSGKDVIIAAETGSGKTHSYLVPLIDRLCSANDDGAGQEPILDAKILLVLCPNVMLCEQVVRMASDLRGENGEQLLKVAAVCGRSVRMIYELLLHTHSAPASNIFFSKLVEFTVSPRLLTHFCCKCIALSFYVGTLFQLGSH